jgi:hypothetical protein
LGELRKLVNAYYAGQNNEETLMAISNIIDRNFTGVVSDLYRFKVEKDTLMRRISVAAEEEKIFLSECFIEELRGFIDILTENQYNGMIKKIPAGVNLDAVTELRGAA